MAVYVGNKKSRMKKGPVLIGLAILVCVIGAGAFFFFGGNDTVEQTPTTEETTPVVEETMGTLPSNAFPITVVTK
ncbi:MAG: hypothetical protein ACRC5Q_03505 [Culicoidibacterales bacterium]